MAEVTRYTVSLTAHFECCLRQIEAFLLETEAPKAFDALLDELTDTVIPNLERFPNMGRLFFARSADSIGTVSTLGQTSEQFAAFVGEGDEVREYVMSNYLVLYAKINTRLYLLSIRHFRQLSFNFPDHWIT